MQSRLRTAGSIKILLTGLASLLIQFGPAIWGWGGSQPFFAHPQFQALVWISVGLGILAAFSGSSGLSSGEKEDRGNRWVLGAGGILRLLPVFALKD